MDDRVIFVKSDDGEITAVFPDLKDGRYFTCYSHVGQHSLCHPDWVNAQMPAEEHEYESLLEEISSIGYVPCIEEMICACQG